MLLSSCLGSATGQTGRLVPPAAPVEAVSDRYGSTTVVDPYRWMERADADARFFPLLEAQNAYRRALMTPLTRQHDALLARLRLAASGRPRVSAWQRAGGRLFYEEPSDDDRTVVLRVLEPNGKRHTLLDPSMFGALANASIRAYSPSNDGRYVAVGVALGRARRVTLRVVDVKTGAVLPDAIDRCDYVAVN